MTNFYDKGDSVRLKGSFTSGSVSIDPTIVTLEVKDPDDIRTVYTYAGGEVTKLSLGIFYRDVTMSKEGQWHYRWYGTGTIIAADEDFLIVEPTEFP